MYVIISHLTRTIETGLHIFFFLGGGNILDG